MAGGTFAPPAASIGGPTGAALHMPGSSPSASASRTSSQGTPTVVLCERDAARRVGLSALIRQSPHVRLGAVPTDEPTLLALLRSDEPVDVLCTSDSVRTRREDRHALILEIHELRPRLPVVYLMATELPAAVRRPSELPYISLVSTREELQRVHEALIRAGAGHRYISPRLRGVLEEPRLTDRQVEILDRMARGEGRPEIARALGVSESTVRSHTKELYKRLGVNDRAHAVAVAMRDVVILPPRSDAG
jgi:DNA-binding NarL/FixJ family response regulator